MKRLSAYIALSAIVWAGAYAAPITPEEALERVGGTLPGLPLKGGSRAVATPVPGKAPVLKKTLKSNDGQPLMYIFDKGNANESEGLAGGFMILSADDAVPALLGYSDSGTIEPDNMPPALVYWLGEYQRQIEYARENGLTRASESTGTGVNLPSTWTALGPLLKTTWDQGAPYDSQCPQVSGQFCYTGCLATSTAQVMNYHQWPAKGTGSISYTTQTLRLSLSMDFSDVTFNWSDMLPSYSGSYTAAQANAVATLMKAVGYAVEMDYTTEESGAASGLIPSALVNYFGYDKGVRYLNRDMYTYTEWAQMIYENLQNYGPVIYDGTGEVGGHSWVCDGYDGNGRFHFNWGWDGLSDGYFLIDALSPPALGIGGSGGDFNYLQSGVFNIQPAKDNGAPAQETVVLFGSLTGVVTSSAMGSTLTLLPIGSLTAGWGYQGLGTYEVFIGLGYTPAENPGEYTYLSESTGTKWQLRGSSYVPADYYLSVNLGRMTLEDGVKYKVVTAYRPVGQEWEEVPAGIGNYNYFYITKEGTSYTVDNLTPLQFEGVSVSVDSELYYNAAVQMSATLNNPNDTELTRFVAPALVNDKDRVAFIGSPQMISIAPGNTFSTSWDTNLTRQSGTTAVNKDTEFYPALYDTQNKVLFYKSSETVTMHKNPGQLQLDVTMDIPGAKKYNSNQPGVYFYDIENGNDFDVETTINVLSGYLADQISIGIFNYGGENQAGNQTYYLMASYPLGDFIFLNAGENVTRKININFVYGKVGGEYYLGLLNGQGSFILDGMSAVIDILGMNNSGVESIGTASGDILFLYDKVGGILNVTGGENGIKSVEAYYLNGMKAPLEVDYYGGNAVARLESLAKGIVVVTAIDGAGNRRTLKLTVK